MTTTLKCHWASDWKCFIAYDGETPEASDVIGEGLRPEDARSDYWSLKTPQANIARLYPYGERWELFNGAHGLLFDTRAEAIAYADEHNWSI